MRLPIKEDTCNLHKTKDGVGAGGIKAKRMGRISPAAEFTGKVPWEGSADTLIGCGRRNVGGKGLQSRVGRVDCFKAGAVLVWPVRFDDFSYQRNQ
jgi:hypothetical protein